MYMPSVFHAFVGELAENWLAFLYIVMTCFFSICFLRERAGSARSEKRLAWHFRSKSTTGVID